MSIINRTTRVHVLQINQNGQRLYLNKPGTKRNDRGDIVLWSTWDSDPAFSRPISYETAILFRRRMLDEYRTKIYFALQAGNTAELIED